jgi:hypothetical protein
MKNNTKPASKTPIDVLRALTTAQRAVEELTAALALIDPAAFGTPSLHAHAVDAAGLATATVLELLAARPLTKTERAARAAAEPVASPDPTPAVEPEPVAPVEEPVADAREARLARRREQDRARRAAKRAAAAA